MKTGFIKFGVVLWLLAVSIVGLYWLFNTSSYSLFQHVSAEQKNNAEVPTQVLQGFDFVDQDGKLFTASMLKDKTVLLNFAFTSCGSVCPIVTRDLVLVQKSLPEIYRNRIMFVTISVDPEHDTPERIRNFMSRMKVDTRNWSWLVADQKTTQKLIAHMRVFDPRKKDPTSNDHRSDLILINKKGQIVQQYQSKGLQTDRLANELIRLDDFSRVAAS